MSLGTILVRAKSSARPIDGHRRTDLDVATQEIACAIGQGQLAYYRQLERSGEIRIIHNAKELQTHWNETNVEHSTSNIERRNSKIGLILAMEGADPIVNPSDLESWHEQGLRVVGLAHYGQGHYAMGTGGAGPLMAKGRALVQEMNRLGMILDLTHSSDPSWYEAIDLATCRLLASHNNCRELVPGDRQFSDEQIKLLIERGGVIGTALDAWMLSPGFEIGKSQGKDVPLSSVVDQIDHVCQIAGNAKHAAIGSDLDGGFGTEQTPDGIETIADMQKLEPLLKARGYSNAEIDLIFHGNWLRFFREALPE